MNITKIKKILISLFLLGYILSFYINQYFYLLNYFLFPKAFAQEQKVQQIKLVAILVDSKLFSSLKDDINWYATNRIQSKFDNTKAIVLPIDTKSLKSWDIVKILQNLYFRWEKDKSSKLVWLVLIWNIPFPVVNYDWFIFPSIYPYVDFVNKKYVFDPKTKFFVYSWKEGGQPEIFHSVIIYNSLDDYKKFFEKLKQYSSNPTGFVSKKFWYDDFEALKWYFSKGNLPFYANKIIFAEALVRHYFTNLLFKLLSTDYDEHLLKSLKDLGKKVKEYEKEVIKWMNNNERFYKVYNLYFQKVNDFVNKWWTSGEKYLHWYKYPSIPTKIIAQAVKNYFRNIYQLFSPSYVEKISENVEATWRWSYSFSWSKNVDTILQKVLIKDTITPLQIEYFNNILKKALDSKIEKEKYYMLYPVLTYYQHYHRNNCWSKYLESQWENFYFWKYAWDITWAKDFTIYRWTFFNVDDPEKLNSIDISSSNLSSIWYTFGFFSRQVEANRGLDVMLAPKDAKWFEIKRCSPSETLDQRVMRNWGWASPLNVDYNKTTSEIKLKFFNYKYAWNPSWDKSIWWWLFDIWGSKKVISEISSAYSWKAYKVFSSIVKTKKAINTYYTNPQTVNETYCGSMSKSLMSYPEFFEKFNFSVWAWDYLLINVTNGLKSKNLIKEKSTCVCWQTVSDGMGWYSTICTMSDDYFNRYYYYYKLIDTRVEHISPTLSEISWLNYVTPNRPIDDPRYITFLGIWWDTVKLIYPDLWKVKVYKKVWNQLVLLTPEDIEKNIKNYLKNLVKNYNEVLKNQLSKSQNYYSQHKKAFDFLAEVDIRATPNRWYNLIPEDYFIKVLGEDNIKVLARILYYQNLGWSKRPLFSNYLEQIKYLRKSFDINERIRYLEDNYLKDDLKENKVNKSLFPKREWKGYEAGLIVSKWWDDIDSSNIPQLISKIEKYKNDNLYNLDFNIKNSLSNQQVESESKCWIPPSWAVPLFSWPSAFMCWLRSLPGSFKVSITDECSFTIWPRNCHLCKWSSDFSSSDEDLKQVFPTNIVSKEKIDEIISTYFRKSYEDFKKIYSKYSTDKINKLWLVYHKEWYNRYLASNNLANAYILTQLDDKDKQLFDKLKKNIIVSIIPNNYTSVDNKNDYFIKISNLNPKELKNLNFKIWMIWQSCLLKKGIYVNNVNLCKDNLILESVSDSEVLLPISWNTTKAWFNLIQLVICKWDVCVLKSKTFILTPAKLSSVKIESIWNRIVKWGVLPIKISGYDIYWNKVDAISFPYRIEIEGGAKLRKWNQLDTWFEFTNFRDAYYFIDLSKDNWNVSDIKIVKVKVEPVFSVNKNLPSVQKEFKVVDASIYVYSWNVQTDKIFYKLPDSYNSKYINLKIKVIDSLWKPISVPLTVQQEWGLFVLPSNYFVVKDWILTIKLRPTYKAWNWKLIFKIWDKIKKIITLTVKPAKSIRTEIRLEKSILKPGETTKATILVKDRYWNVIDEVNNLQVWLIWNLKFVSKNGNSFVIKALDWGGVSYIYSFLKNLPLDKQIPDYKKIEIQTINWPTKHINIMYLSLFWTDWWNLWGYFSENKNVATLLQSTSNKNLAITTYLIDPEKVYKTLYVINQNGKILCPTNQECNVSLSLSWWYIYYDFPNIGKIEIWKYSDFKLVLNSAELNTNFIQYKPIPTDSQILSNEIDFNGYQILVNKKVVVDFKKGVVTQWMKFSYSSWYFDVYWKNKLIGKLKIYRNDSYIVSKDNITLSSSQYWYTKWRWEWSTNWSLAILIYDTTQKLSDVIDWQDPSDVNTYNVWFKGFSNIVDWAWGLTVWQATKFNANEFLINFWDAFLKRVDKNDIIKNTNFDWSRWEKIFYSENGGIKKVLVWDFNNDGLKDVIIAKDDGSVVLLKNYWWSFSKFTDLGDLMLIWDWIKDIFDADVNWDWYDDLIVWTNKWKLRVYYNLKWRYQIDWRLICLDVPGWPYNLNNIKQIFVKDMDGDGKVDIVTNDIDWNVKIFYWNSYVSKDVYVCDKDWKRRLQEKLIKSFGLKLVDKKVYDNSLVHWKGLKAPNPWKGIWTILSNDWKVLGKYNYLNNLWSNNKLENIENLYNKKVNESLIYNQKYVDVPSNIWKPVYENITWDSVKYAIIAFLSWDDKVEIFKKFEKIDGNNTSLKKWDVVKVTVFFKNRTNHSLKLTYLENLIWPWEVDVDNSWLVLGFNVSGIWNNYLYRSDVDPYLFKLDNIQLWPKSQWSISRFVIYRGYNPVKIDIWIFNKDLQKIKWLPQIIFKPTNWCVKQIWLAINNWKNNNRDYDFRRINLADKVKFFDETNNKKIQKKLKDIQSKLSKGDLSVLNEYAEPIEDITDLEVTNDDSINFEDFLTNGLEINLSVFDNKTLAKLANKLENFSKNLCKWFSLWWDNGKKCTLEPPFNVSFFTPGVFNVFGCPVWWDWWRTVFWFPWTKWKSCKWNPCCIPIPMPNKTSIAPFVDPPNQFKPNPCPWVYKSKIRLYISPTLTMWLWIVVCFGDYLKGLVSPVPPWWTIKWNCVVVAFKDVLCKDKNKKGWSESENNWFVLNSWQYLLDWTSCKKPLWWTDKLISPFELIENHWVSDYSLDLFEINDPNWFVINSSFLKLERNNIWNALKAKEILLKQWIPINLKIQWWNLKWLVQCIIKKWLDNQIRYIINALTNMTIYVYIPDLSNLSKWLDKIVDIFKNFNDNELISDIKKAWSEQTQQLKTDIWEYNRKSVLFPKKKVYKDISKITSNPFEQLAKFFEDVPLINIQTRSIVIKLPWLSEEEFNRMKSYLTGWWEENRDVYKEWEKFIVSMWWKCENLKKKCQNINKEKEKQKCLKQYSDCEWKYKEYIKVYSNIQEVFNIVKRDIQAIDAWMRFPLQLYGYLHIVDKLIQSIVCILDKFFLAIINWFHQNAVRFEKWVDFIILMIAIIKTWQILIDFSVKWKRSCGKCRVDNYDFYDCLLSLFCIDLPILPIPPFKLPDIYIDLTHINLWINIILPEFHFRPIKLPYIYLPTLPYPPKLNIWIKLPLPPKIPFPPRLPDIRITIPTPEIKLPPLLPPAPKIPPILPAIKVVVNLAEWIWKFWCIIKNNIWLVAERNVKTRVEQLTQRYSRVFPFDFLELTLPKFPFPKYYDVRIDAFVNLKINFELVYEIAKGLADVINWFTNWIVDEIRKWSMRVNDGGAWFSINVPDVNVDVNFQSYMNKKFKEIMYYKTSSWDIATEKYFNTLRKKLVSDLDYLKNKLFNKKTISEISSIQNILQQSVDLSLSEKNLEKAINKAKNVVLKRKEEIERMENILKSKWRDWLQQYLWKNILVEDKKIEKNIVIYSKIFNINPKIKSFIQNSNHPLLTYLSLNKKIVDWINRKLNDKSYIQLWMTKSDYQKIKIYFANLDHNLTTSLKLFANSVNFSSDTVASSNKKSSQLDKWLFSLYNMQDISQYIHWLFVKWIDGRYYNVVYDLDFADEIRKKKTYIEIDVNGDGVYDLVIWDKKQVYIKRGNENDVVKDSPTNYFSEFYFSPVISKDNIESLVDEKWYLSIKGEKFKIWSDDLEVDGFERVWGSYDSMWVRWYNLRKFDWYLLIWTDRIDNRKDKKNIESVPDEIRYVLVLPKKVDISAIKIKYKNLNWFVYDLQKQWKLTVKQIDWTNTLSVYLNLKPRKWRYVKIIWLKYESIIPDLKNVLVKSTPLSNQILLWNDVWSDNSLPVADIRLIRKKTDEVVDKWTNLVWYINTHYYLDIKWKDNTFISDSRIEDLKGNVLAKSKDWKLSVEIYSTGNKIFKFYVYWKDINDNLQKMLVEVNIIKPNLQISKVDLDPSWTYAKIISKLSHSIDEWVVRFYRYRNWYWELLTGKKLEKGWVKQISDFIVDYNSEVITWWLFFYNWNVVLKDINWNVVWQITTDWEIEIKKPYKVYVDISNWIPMIQVFNSLNGKIIWSIFLKPEKLIKVEINWDYSLLDLENSYYWIFNGWKCVLNKNLNQCVMYISPQGLIYIPTMYRSFWDYVKYLYKEWNIIYKFLAGSDLIEIYEKK